MATYLEASDVQEIVGSLITTVHDHSRLANAEIRVVFRDQHAKSKGRPVYGKARKVTGLNAYLAKAADPVVGFFVIELAYDIWHQLEPYQQRALVDHELSHCHVGYDDDTAEKVLQIVGHDVEEFHAIARRHGAWRPAIATFAEIAGQQSLSLRTASGVVAAD